MAPKVNRKLIDGVEAGWTAIALRANSQRRALGTGRGDPAHVHAAVPPYLRPDSDLDAQIHEWGGAMRERFQRARK